MTFVHTSWFCQQSYRSCSQ